MLPVKPVELVDYPGDNQAKFAFYAPATNTTIYQHQVLVPSGGNTVSPAQSANTTGYLLAMGDNGPTLRAHGGHEGPGGSAGDLANFLLKPIGDRVRALGLTGRRVIVTVDDTLTPAHIGARKTFKQSGPYTVLDLASNPASGGAVILGVVEGGFGVPNSRVLVRVEG